MKKKVNFKLAEILVALLVLLVLGICVSQGNSNFADFNKVIEAKHVKGDLGKFTVPKKMRGTWYGKYFDINGIKAKKVDKIKITAHTIAGSPLHKQEANFKGTKIPKAARNWSRTYYPVKFKKDKGIKYISMYPWVSPVLSGESLGLYHYKGHKVLIDRTTSSFRITNVYWKTRKLAKKYGGHKPKELKRYGEW